MFDSFIKQIEYFRKFYQLFFVLDAYRFYHFVTSLCAIVGGVFTVVGMFDSALFATWNAVAKKNAMGKLI